MNEQYVIGVDFGTDTVRAILVAAADGREITCAEFAYPRWLEGKYCDPAKNQFRQHPRDHAMGLQTVVKACLRKAGPTAAAKVKAISVATTGSTPITVDWQGVPLAFKPEFSENPDALFFLWKDHAAIAEAEEINAHVARCKPNYLTFSGGVYSSEWYWAKLLYLLRRDKAIRKACYTFVEHCDWIPFMLTGGTDADHIKRSRCAAGHKAMWSAVWGGYPADEFFYSLDPLLAGFAAWLPKETYTADQPAGTLCPAWAAKLGLGTDVIIGCGALDAHMGAVGAQIEPYHLVKVIGTSTCDMLIAPNIHRPVKGISGEVNGSIVPGMTGYEAGQSAFGDVYAWFANLIAWPLENLLAKSQLLEPGLARLLVKESQEQLLSELSKAAQQLTPEEKAEIALDWLNGRRTPDANQRLKVALTQMSLGTGAPRLFRALAEATYFGARAIIKRFIEEGITVQGIIGTGGITRKSPYVMQLMADVLQTSIRVSCSEQTCALGAAMFAAVCAGIYPDMVTAMRAIGGGFDYEYLPDQNKAAFYHTRYQKYVRLGYFIEEELHG